MAPSLTTLVSPKLTAPLLLALLSYPNTLRAHIPTPLLAFLDQLSASRGFLLALKTVLALGLLRLANKKYSDAVVNNWKKNAKFIKSQELVLITGGSSGIGAVTAKGFAAKGVKVVIIDLQPSKEAFPHGVYFYKGDVTDATSISKAAAAIRKDHGNPTVLINNAGIGLWHTILDAPMADIRKVFEVNTISHYTLVKEFVPAMVSKNHGHVVTVASLASFVAIAGSADYSCTKASALAFHEGLATELRWRYNAPDVRTSVVHPTWVRTPLIDELVAQASFKDPVLEPEVVSAAIIKQVMLGKSGQLILPEYMSVSSMIRGMPLWFGAGVRKRLAKVLDFSDRR